MNYSLILNIGMYFLAFAAVWLGSGFVVSSLSHFIKAYRLPAFVTSFYILGILTSLPEIGIGAVAVIQHDPIIFVGNLLGGTVVLFLLIIPLLGFFGNGLSQPRTLSYKQLFFILSTVLAPALLSLDRVISVTDGIILLLIYLFLPLCFLRQRQIVETTSERHARTLPLITLLPKIIVGIGILVISSQYIVHSTVYFAEMMQVSKFMVSLLVISVGTNIPELSLIFRSLLQKQKQLAFADYLGSAAANTVILGILTIIHGQDIVLPQRAIYQSFSIILGLILFFFFVHSKNKISKIESFILFVCYCLFLFCEVLFFLSR